MCIFFSACTRGDIRVRRRSNGKASPRPGRPTPTGAKLGIPETSRYLVARSSPTLPPMTAAPPTRRLPLLRALLPPFAKPSPPSPYPIVGYGGLWLMVNGDLTTIAVARPIAARASAS